MAHREGLQQGDNAIFIKGFGMTQAVTVHGTTLPLYGESLPLATDQYQLTMGQAYWQQGMTDHEAVFTYAFRDNPFDGGYAVCAGLAYVAYFVQHLKEYGFSAANARFLASLSGNDGKPLFSKGYLDFLRHMAWELQVDAIPEGTVVFAHEPTIRVYGPIIACQIVESFVLAEMNFQTLIATKAARICLATGWEPVSEQGLRRAHGLCLYRRLRQHVQPASRVHPWPPHEWHHGAQLCHGLCL
jgi:nicotinate phosphoribosyltransferase